MLNLIRNLDTDIFEPIMITIYEEHDDSRSMLKEFLPYVRHYFVPINKTEILLGRTKKLKKVLEEQNPSIIHSLGVFPDFAVSRMQFDCQVITARNFVFIDYPTKYGKAVGYIMALMHLYSMKKAKKVFACSKSLSYQYLEKLEMNIPFVCNGVDISSFYPVNKLEKYALRNKLSLPKDKKIIIYSGQFIERKNQRFLIEAFTSNLQFKNDFLVIIGNGKDYKELKDTYGKVSNIKLPGNVNNVKEYLQAADIYVSTSKSEGLPNGVLEAMATALPVVLSDIAQHKEIFSYNDAIGKLYAAGDLQDFVKSLEGILKSDLVEMGANALKSVNENFSANIMSKNYQREYLKIIKGINI